MDSIAKTRDAGCRPYMAPERIDPQRAKGYDIRSDVWSLGITLIELSTGKFPYRYTHLIFFEKKKIIKIFSWLFLENGTQYLINYNKLSMEILPVLNLEIHQPAGIFR